MGGASSLDAACTPQSPGPTVTPGRGASSLLLAAHEELQCERSGSTADMR